MSETHHASAPLPRVAITPEAMAVIDQLRDTHGPLLFHQSGGCCDGSSPMCLAQDDFRVGSRDLQLGEIHGCPFYMAPDTYTYFANMHITVDVTPGRGASFSLEIPLGVRFLTVSRVLGDDELTRVAPAVVAATA
ncbi:MAG: DUF779 domain-containing protein [Acidobacteriota bacterium]